MVQNFAKQLGNARTAMRNRWHVDRMGRAVGGALAEYARERNQQYKNALLLGHGLSLRQEMPRSLRHAGVMDIKRQYAFKRGLAGGLPVRGAASGYRAGLANTGRRAALVGTMQPVLALAALRVTRPAMYKQLAASLLPPSVNLSRLPSVPKTVATMSLAASSRRAAKTSKKSGGGGQPLRRSARHATKPTLFQPLEFAMKARKRTARKKTPPRGKRNKNGSSSSSGSNSNGSNNNSNNNGGNFKASTPPLPSRRLAAPMLA